MWLNASNLWQESSQSLRKLLMLLGVRVLCCRDGSHILVSLAPVQRIVRLRQVTARLQMPQLGDQLQENSSRAHTWCIIQRETSLSGVEGVLWKAFQQIKTDIVLGAFISTHTSSSSARSWLQHQKQNSSPYPDQPPHV